MLTNGIIKINEAIYKEGDYLENGLLHCGKCKTQKETLVDLGEGDIVVACICECEQARIEQEKVQEREMLKAQSLHKRKSLIASQYQNIYMKDSDSPLPKIQSYIENFEEFKKGNIGLMISGDVGNGKTFIASIIANELCERGYRVLMTPITNALDMVAQYENISYMDLIANVDLLILDDFGASRNTEFQNEQLNKLIDTRYSNKRPIIITTNLTRQELVSTNDISLTRTYNRIIEMTHPLVVNTPSRRLEISKKRYSKVEEMLTKEKE